MRALVTLTGGGGDSASPQSPSHTVGDFATAIAAHYDRVGRVATDPNPVRLVSTRQGGLGATRTRRLRMGAVWSWLSVLRWNSTTSVPSAAFGGDANDDRTPEPQLVVLQGGMTQISERPVASNEHRWL